MRKRGILRRGISLILCVCMLVSLMPAGAVSAQAEERGHPFWDVSEKSWYADPVKYAWENQFFKGVSDHRFEPEGTMTRAMFVTVLARMAGVDVDEYGGGNRFRDIREDSWYVGAVAWAEEYGITQGTGEETFSPDTPVDRQQMATFFARYFDIFGVTYETGKTVSGLPGDMAQVSDWAGDAVTGFWQSGLLIGDGANFAPTESATRAQMATLCMRVDQAVDTWHSKPGIPSEAPETEPSTSPTQPVQPTEPSQTEQPTEPEETTEPEELPDIPTIPNMPDGDVTEYFEVKFQLGEGLDVPDIAMPDTKLYPKGTKIGDLPTPYAAGQVFLGWYYDKALADRAATSDTVGANMTLYASVTAIEEVPFLETPSYCTMTDVGGDFTFQVKAASEEAVREVLTVIQVSANNAEVTDLTITGSEGVFTVSGAWAPGHTYTVRIAEDSGVVFVLDGQPQPDSTDTLNFLTAKEEVLNLSLNEDMIFIPKDQVSGMSESLSGLFTVSMDSADNGGVQQVKDSGSFTYSGGETIEIGDVVAIYNGALPSTRTVTTDNETVVYVTISDKKGNTYHYATADAEDVMFTPDVLPVSVDADTDGVEDDAITVDKSVLDFSGDAYAQMGLSAQTTVDVGDYLAFYSGTFGGENASVASYARITDISGEGSNYTLQYKAVTLEEVMASMDIYNTRTEEIGMSDDEIAAMEADIKQQAIDSGFVEEAVDYLAAMALETDGFRELSENTNLTSLSVVTEGQMDRVRGGTSGLARAKAKGSVEITEKKVDAKIKVGPNALEHFEDGAGGMRAELTLTFEMEIKTDEDSDNKIVISVEAVFEQEVLLGINVSGGTIWKWAWIIPYIYDYQLNANFDVGTYTGIAVTATMATAGEDDEEEEEEEDEDDGIFDFEWGSVLGDDEDEDEEDDDDEDEDDDPYVNIGKQIEELMEQGESFFGEDANGEENSEEDEPIHMSLLEQYAEMMESAEDSWIELVRKELFSIEGSVDPFHILVYGVSADFVVSANMYITLGMTFEYGNAKRYNFSLMLFHQQSTSETIDLETAHYEFIFYVMGTLGIRAGVEFEIAVGLISLKLDSIGITAEAGAYAQLCGYFYYKLTWTEGSEREQFCAGAMYFELGIYLEIKFKAQLFSSDKLTYNPTLYENEWPMLTVGERENVYDFNYGSDDEDLLAYEFQTVRTLSLPTELFEMRYMDLRSGELYGADADDEGENPGKNFDDATESRFTVLFSNPAFAYDPAGNTVIITPASDSTVSEETEMTILWKGGTLAFTSIPISRTLRISWTDPQNTRYIAFHTRGGSSVEMISTGPGEPITEPAAPTKQGYIFGGWYVDEACTQAFVFPEEMPNYGEPDRGITVYAKWDPAPNTYTVEYYAQEFSGKYTLMATQVNSGLTDSKVDPNLEGPEGFALNESRSKRDQTVAANGTTLVKLYFDRQKYTLTFTYGDKGNDMLSDIVFRDTKYGAIIYEPKMNLGGYVFAGWEGGITFTDAEGNPTQTMPAEDATFHATWTPDPNVGYRVEYYIQDTVQDKWLYNSAQSGTGETDSLIPLDAYTVPGDGLVFNGKVTVDGAEVQAGDPLLKIKGDGSLVVKVYFDRALHEVTFDSDGGTPVEAQTVRHGGKAARPADPEKTGYTFAGWADGQLSRWNFGEQAVSEDVTLIAQWTPNANTAYTVEHYLQNVSGDGYTLADTESKYGTTGEQTAARARTYEGFLEAKAFAQAGIAADGSTVVKIYYDRRSVAVTFSHDGTSAAVPTQPLRWDGRLTAPATPEKTGYVFAGWLRANGTAWNFETDTVTEDLVLTAAWNPADDTAYTVNHYLEALDGSYPDVPEATESLFGTTEEIAQVTLRTFPGFGEGEYAEEEIAADGTTLIRIYYPRSSYTLTWLDWDGETELGSSVFLYEAEITVPDNVIPARMGYTFVRWTQAGTMPARAWTVTADADTTVWAPNTYGVLFDLNYEGAAEAETILQTFDSGYLLPEDPQREGYVFTGWYTRDGKLVDETDEVTLAEDHTLYARWEYGTATAYTVKHWQQNVSDDEYAEVETDRQNLTGTTEAATNAQAKTYTGFTALKFEQEEIAPDGSTVVNIYYDRDIYEVIWDVDGEQTTLEYRYGAAIAEAVAPSKEHYTFNGWKDYTGGMTMGTQDLIFEAMWTPVTYAVTLWLNGGDINETFNSYVYSQGKKLPEVSRTGYDFAGWYDNAELTGDAVAEITPEDHGDKVFYAKWSAHTYTVVFDPNGGEGEMAEQVFSYDVEQSLYANAFTKWGYTFIGWNTMDDGYGNSFREAHAIQNLTAEDQKTVTLYAQWTATEYTITYDLAGGTAENPGSYFVTDEGFTLTAPTKTGYTFAGWTGTDLSEITEEVTIESGSTGDRAYTANWTANRYCVTFDNNGGDGSGGESVVEYCTNYGKLPNPSRTGYDFAGWYTVDGKEVTEATRMETPADHTLYAHWTVIKYNIVYRGVDGLGEVETTYSDEDRVINLPVLTRTGYTFVGWQCSEADIQDSGAGGYIVTVHAGVTGDIAITGTWTPVSYTIAFIENGGGEVADITQGYETDLPELPVPTRTGYVFAGWYRDSELTNTFTDPTMPLNGATLYAKWTAVAYNITYTLDGGSEAGNPAAYTVEKLPITLDEPTRTGYTFAGWTGSNGDTPNPSVEIEVDTTGDLNYTANWTANTYDFSVTVKYDFRMGGESYGDAWIEDAAGSKVTASQLTFDETYTLVVSPTANYTVSATRNGKDVSLSGNRYTFTAGSENKFVVAFKRNTYQASASWYKVEFTMYPTLECGKSVTAYITWADGTIESATIGDLVKNTPKTLAFSKSGTYPTNVRYATNGYIANTLVWNTVVTDLSGNNKNVWSGDKRYDKTVDVSTGVSCGGVAAGAIPTVGVSSDGTATIALTTYGINSAALSGLTYTTNSGAVDVSGNNLVIYGARLSAGQQTIVVYANGTQVQSITVVKE